MHFFCHIYFVTRPHLQSMFIFKHGHLQFTLVLFLIVMVSCHCPRFLLLRWVILALTRCESNDRLKGQVITHPLNLKLLFNYISGLHFCFKLKKNKEQVPNRKYTIALLSTCFDDFFL